MMMIISSLADATLDASSHPVMAMSAVSIPFLLFIFLEALLHFCNFKPVTVTQFTITMYLQQPQELMRLNIQCVFSVYNRKYKCLFRVWFGLCPIFQVCSRIFCSIECDIYIFLR